jgi:hypothetical protein
MVDANGVKYKVYAESIKTNKLAAEMSDSARSRHPLRCMPCTMYKYLNYIHCNPETFILSCCVCWGIVYYNDSSDSWQWFLVEHYTVDCIRVYNAILGVMCVVFQSHTKHTLNHAHTSPSIDTGSQLHS